MKLNAKSLATVLLAVAAGASVQACIPVIVGGTGVAVAMASDRRSSGAYVDDESIEWKSNRWIDQRLGDKVHVNSTSYNRKLLLTGEAFNEAARDEAGRIAASVDNVREVVNELRIAPSSSLANRTNDGYITSKVKARFVDQKEFNLPQVKVVTEASTVYLLGLVSQREGDAATEIARTTSGVQKVVRVFEYISEDDVRRLDSTPRNNNNSNAQ